MVDRSSHHLTGSKKRRQRPVRSNWIPPQPFTAYRSSHVPFQVACAGKVCLVLIIHSSRPKSAPNGESGIRAIQPTMPARTSRRQAKALILTRERSRFPSLFPSTKTSPLHHPQSRSSMVQIAERGRLEMHHRRKPHRPFERPPSHAAAKASTEPHATPRHLTHQHLSPQLQPLPQNTISFHQSILPTFPSSHSILSVRNKHSP